MGEIGIGVIGCGKIAQVRHIPEYQEHPKGRLIGFYDMNLERGKELAEKYGATAFKSIEELLANPKIEAVSVCTANQTHAEISIAAMKAGKHVLCEKPMAVTLKECEDMVAVASETGRYLMIGQNQRLSGAHVKAKELINRGEIGRIVTVRTCFGHGGPETWSVDSGQNVWFFDKGKAVMGAMADLGVHKTDLLQFLCGSEIKRVTARIMTLDKRRADGTPIDVDDNAFCIYEFENGVVASMTASWTYYGMEDNSTVLYGTDGIMRIYDDPDHSIVVIKRNGQKYMYDVEAIQTNDKQTRSGVIDLWMECLIEKRQPKISGDSVLPAMRAVFAAIESDKQEKTITLGGS